MPLLIALGIDYGIFIIFKGTKTHSLLHPAKAVIIAALSTLIGFGSLMAAQHKVLFIIGFMVFTGILTSILVSVFILPPFLTAGKKEKNEL
jgi:predicted RND superfamily exporter protein